MRIVVTGGSGHTGRAVVEHLLEFGHQVLVVDRQPPRQANHPYKLVDLEDFGQTVDVLQQADAVVHLAAIPRPVYHSRSTVFRTNVVACYNVFEAAALLKIPRLVYASSISVTGYPFYERFIEPVYLPIDELHPLVPQDPYGLSKLVGEQIADSFVRRTDMTVISLRMPWIHTPETFIQEIAPHRHDPAFGASNLWLYVDARDVALACRLSLTADLTGHQAFFVAAPDTFMTIPSQELVRSFYPHSQIRPELEGRTSLVSSRKAEHVLGFAAQYTWETYIH